MGNDVLKIWDHSFLQKIGYFERTMSILNKILSIKLTAWPLKMYGWKMIHFLWGPTLFSGAFAVSL